MMILGDLTDLTTLGDSTLHRCDACGHQAFAAARRVGHTTLIFCGHHVSRYFDSLVQDGWIIDDRRDKINEAPSVSANVA